MEDDNISTVIEEDIGPCVSFWNYFFQSESGSIRRISLPFAWYNTVRFLQTNAKGRSPSHLDTETREVLKESPHLTYSEAMVLVLERYCEDPNFLADLYQHLDDDEKLKRDDEDFWAVIDARQDAWRRVNGDYRKPLPATFEAI